MTDIPYEATFTAWLTDANASEVADYLRTLTQHQELMDAANTRISATSDVRHALEALANALEQRDRPKAQMTPTGQEVGPNPEFQPGVVVEQEVTVGPRVIGRELD
jgi:nitrate reductase assembly molybdenum cofactor insertion protein NarJ